MIGSPDNTGARWSQRMTETTANPEACLIIIGKVAGIAGTLEWWHPGG